MPNLKLQNCWLWLLFALLASWPISVYAALALESRHYSAPFLFSWVGIWFFAAGGGVSACFIKISDIDNRLYFAWLAKLVIGTFSGVSLCLLIASNTKTPEAALTFWSFFAALFSAPLVTGALVYISNQKRLDNWFNRVSKNTIERRYPLPDDHKRGDKNDTDLY